MNKIKKTIQRIEKLEATVLNLERFINIPDTQSMTVTVNNNANEYKLYFYGLETFGAINALVQSQLDAVNAELLPLKERIRLISELI